MQHQLNMLKNNSGVKTNSMYKSNFKLHYPLLVTAVVIGSSAIASPSSLTPAVIGHKPTVDNILLDKTAPVLGDTLNVTYDYQDIDGDADASTIKWLYNGIEVAGQTAKQYTPVLNINTGVGNACGDFQVAAEVTAQSHTGDPKLGTAKTSAPVSVALATIPDFTFPDTTTRNWDDAKKFCEAKGMQLPTRAQLQTVFNTYTSGGANYEMAEIYGWPLNGGRCGGSYFIYWTSEAHSSGYHWVVRMDIGTAYGGLDTFDRQVTCVR
ncbi:hypothetical protein H9Y13_13040 [Aeromonas veronii]|uniref:hypothetical protein n=1 Tax=Aeromonas TaxID=642 RepID=UPI0022EA1AB7|nr:MULTISPECIES: hypothetical protein [Aeromonas]KAJ8739034.1 hypothetical protein H9Y13_13040 [Aeromonas veronii]MDA3318365.1 DUF1566 domain-containing protein [Aeromonas sp. PI_26]